MTQTRKKLIVLFVLVAIALAGLGRFAPAIAQQSVPGDPAVALGKPSGQDTFDNANNWTLFDSQCFKSEIKDGKYYMTAKGVKDYTCWEVTWPLLQNFYLEVDVQTPQACSPNDAYGVLFRAPDNNRGYLYGLTCDGRYYLNIFDGQTTTQLIKPSSNPAILVGAGKVNRMGVVVYGAQYQLYANGYYLNQAVDSTYLDPGKIGFFVRSATTQPYTVAFDNLKVWQLNQNYYPPSQPPPVYPPVQPVPPTSTSVTGTSTASLNVRSGPSMDYPILGTVPPGTTRTNHWYQPGLPVVRGESANFTLWQRHWLGDGHLCDRIEPNQCAAAGDLCSTAAAAGGCAAASLVYRAHGNFHRDRRPAHGTRRTISGVRHGESRDASGYRGTE